MKWFICMSFIILAYQNFNPSPRLKPLVVSCVCKECCVLSFSLQNTPHFTPQTLRLPPRFLFLPPQFLILTPRTLQNGYLTLFGDCPTQRIPPPPTNAYYMVYGQLCTKYIGSRCIWTKDSQGLVSTVVTPDSWKSASSKNLSKTAPNGIK